MKFVHARKRTNSADIVGKFVLKRYGTSPSDIELGSKDCF